MIREYIPTLLEDHDLTREQAEAAMMDIMSGQATPSQVSAFLIGLKKKGETVDEITAIARVMRSFSRTVTPKVDGCLLDTCGTGGDRTKTFNVSTTAAFVIAAAGVRVAKHGNRSFTSRCGSADLLEQLGVNLEIEPALVEKAIDPVDQLAAVPGHRHQVAFDQVLVVHAEVQTDHVALHKAGVPAELHVFESGPHGQGLALGDPVLGEWGTLLRNWMRERGLVGN